jgi:hypothetical protein
MKRFVAIIRFVGFTLPFLAIPAIAQDAAPIHVRGTLTAVAGTVLTVQPATGTPFSVNLDPAAKIIVSKAASLADIKPGTYVGIANVGDDGKQDALEVHIFPDAMRGTGDGQRNWDLGKKSRMTNGAVGKKVEAYDGQSLTLSYKGGESTVMVRPNTPVVSFQPGTKDDLKSGATIFIRDGKRQPDGSISAGGIVVGQGVAKPPM